MSGSLARFLHGKKFAAELLGNKLSLYSSVTLIRFWLLVVTYLRMLLGYHSTTYFEPLLVEIVGNYIKELSHTHVKKKKNLNVRLQ
jgi:hypothetical protein